MAMEKEERFNRFRGELLGLLIHTLGAMAAEHTFYGENSAGVSGDVQTATARAAWMVGVYGMGPESIRLTQSFDTPEDEEAARERINKRLEKIGLTIMNRSTGEGAFNENPLGAVLGDRYKREAAAQLLGYAYITAYALMSANRDGIEKIAQALIERKELYGDEVVDLLDSVQLTRPDVDLLDERTWPPV
jgi:cell division protease FtsH